jgi:hypothetical protein
MATGRVVYTSTIKDSWPLNAGLLCGLTMGAVACALAYTFVSSLSFGHVT